MAWTWIEAVVWGRPQRGLAHVLMKSEIIKKGGDSVGHELHCCSLLEKNCTFKSADFPVKVISTLG